MRAFEVHLNGKKVCTAGLPRDCVLTAIVNHVSNPGEGFGLTVGGLNCAIDEHVRWKNARLRVGDEVRVKIVETDSVDRPSKRFKRDRAKELETQKRYVREAAKKLGWRIQARSPKARKR